MSKASSVAGCVTNTVKSIDPLGPEISMYILHSVLLTSP